MSEIKSAFVRAWNVCKSHPLDCFRFLALEICLRGICLAPALLFLVDEVRFLGFLCPVMYAFIVFPSRQNAAASMKQCLNGGVLFSSELVSVKNYRKKLISGLKSCLLLLLWGLPLTAILMLVITVYFSQAVEGVTDVFSVARSIRDFGGGSLESGAKLGIALLLLSVILLALGIMFHSSRRHMECAENGRKILRCHGFRRKLLRLSAISLVLFFPFAISLAAILWNYVGGFVSSVFSIISGAAAALPQHVGVKIAVSFLLLFLPFIPVRQLWTAAFIDNFDKECGNYAP